MGGSAPRRKGLQYERELAECMEEAGFTVRRAPRSDGRALGEAPGVDMLLGEVRVQAKRRAVIASYLTPPPGADVTVVREDYNPQSLVVMKLETFLERQRQLEGLGSEEERTGPRPLTDTEREGLRRVA